ncbi:hypothetical protein DJ568_07970 [Mucilaginibacter hurinus]|uniref:Uncharacterized protein n=1 Tax=Mucilaginibacter hurinus TaxID=2201324 RepID=A0A367GPW0_9SPHI|nr:hypothetical protein [Mucilaginibacter hurinus]RCH55118.1 hypothetical protein DJ568_07970 [Mucilaginibacter hurinus]
MSDEINNKKVSVDVPEVPGDEQAIDKKLDELIGLLENNGINSEKAKYLQEKLNDAIENSTTGDEDIEAFMKLDTENTSRSDLLDEFSILLSSHKIDSNTSKNYLKSEKSANIVLTVISLVMITLGFAMIIMPAPPSFEVFTVFYFTANDGVTLMDLVSLLIVLSGVYLLIKSFNKYSAYRKDGSSTQ